MPPAIRRIETLVPKRAADYGGKACHLAKLARAGFPVPAAIAIPAAVAEALFAERLGVEDRPAALLAREVVPEARLASIRARVRAVDLGAALERELREALEALRREGNVSFAVRSSSTREDGADASAAGLHQTHLHRQTDAEVFAAVRDCWASLFTERALTYLRRHGAAEAGMGVVVQAMVNADVAGVAFTANPLTGDGGEIVITAAYGLGTSVADGRVSPDTIRIDKATRGPRDRVIGDKLTRVVLRPVPEGEPTEGEPGAEDDLAARTVEEEVPVALRSELCLDAAQVDTLTTLALRVEESFGQPQDIEWAFAGSQVFMLQARPITTPVDIESWRKRSDVPRIDRARIVWSNVNVGEALPGVATPLTWSILSSFSELGFRRAFGSLGCSVPRDAELVGEFRGRIYLNLTEFMSILSQVPGLRPKTLLALGGGGMGDRLETDIVPRSRAAFFARLPVTAARYAHENYNITERVRAFESFYESERRRIESVDPALLSPASMAALLRDVEHLLDEAGAVMLTVYGNLLASVVLLQGVLALVVSEQADTVQRDLLGGLADVDSAAPGVTLYHIAESIAREPAVRDVILGQPAAQLRVSSLPDGPTRRSLQRFLEAYGHRGTREAEVAVARWAEDPTLLFATLQIHLRQAASGAPRHQSPVQMAERQRVARETALALVSERLPLPARTAVRHLLALVQRFMRLRERLRSHVTAVLGLFRRVALDTSRRIESVEPAAGTDAAFYLTLDEIDAFLRDGSESLAVRVQRRRRRVERDRALPDPPDTFVGYPPPVSIEAPDTDTLVGLSACAGDVTGTVRVLESPADAADFQAGEILVSACADVGWSPLFLVASAVITDLGGPLSHAAIVLREYGVPSVVNVKSGTRLLRTGDQVRVEGGAGRVHILSRVPRG
jgi:phosphohistidine swiveling domain-containing protein